MFGSLRVRKRSLLSFKSMNLKLLHQTEIVLFSSSSSHPFSPATFISSLIIGHMTVTFEEKSWSPGSLTGTKLDERRNQKVGGLICVTLWSTKLTSRESKDRDNYSSFPGNKACEDVKNVRQNTHSDDQGIKEDHRNASQASKKQ